MTWLYAASAVSIFGLAMYLLGKRAGLRENAKNIQHFAEVLLKQPEDIDKMRLLGKNGAVEVEDIDEFLRERRN